MTSRLAATATAALLLAGSGAPGPPFPARPATAPPGAVPDTAGQAADLLLVGTIRTLVDGRAAGALAVRDGRIAAIGDPAGLDSLEGPGTRVVDLGDGALVPAFTDHHVHLLNLGMSLLNQRLDHGLFLDLSGVGSLEELERLVHSRAMADPAGGWVLGKGWSQSAWGSRALPSRAVLDSAADRTPVYLTRVDAHAGWANRTALEEAGLLRAAPDPPGGEIRRGPDGTPWGVLLERANEPVVARLPRVDDEDVIRAFRLASRALAERGVVEAHDAGFLAPPGLVALNAGLGRYLELLLEADRREPLPLRIELMVPAPSELARQVLERPADFRELTDRIGVSHLKLFADGALGSRGAALTHAYHDDPGTRGVPRMTAEEILDWSRRAVDAGLDVATHAIGDEAVSRTLDAYEELLEERPGLDPRRLRVEHFSYARPADFRRAVELGVVLSIQSNFNSPADLKPSFAARRVGPERQARVYAWRRLHEAGARLAEGSDYFTLPGPALTNFHAALTARNGLGTFGPGARGRLPALRLQARRWTPGGGPPRPGRLQVGRAADLAVLSSDPLTVPEPALMDVRVRATFRAGRAVHDDGTLTSP